MPNPKDPEKLKLYKEKQSKIALARGYGKWMTGRKLSPETIDKIKAKQIVRGNSPEEKKFCDQNELRLRDTANGC